ncbi:MAG: response regulator [Planctomycetaceae bacterium]
MSDKRKAVTFLMADDDPDDRLLAQKALKEYQLSSGMKFVEDGEELMDYLLRRGRFEDPQTSPRPGVILLDLNMPKKDGRQALEEIKSDPVLRRIPVVVMTTSKAEEDVLRTYDLGVNAFITKPVTFQGLTEVMKVLSMFWFEVVRLPEEQTAS